MLSILLNYVAVCLIIQALIVFTEVLITFKRPVILKIIILLLTTGLAWRGIGSLYFSHYSYNRWIIETPQSLLVAAVISFFAYLYESKLKWYIISFGLLMIITHIVCLAYFTFIVSIDPGIPLWNLPGAGDFVKLAKIIFTSLIFVINLRIVLKILAKYKRKNIYFIQLRKWTLYLLTIELFTWISLLVNQNSQSQNSSLPSLCILILNFLTLLLLLFRPKFLNRSNLKIKLGNLFDKKTGDDLPEHLFIEVFFTDAFYLDRDASVETLKKRLNVSADVLSNFLYANYGSGLTDLINKHRINYFIDLVNTGKFSNYTIDAIAQEAGFSSRFHLYKSFKRFHGGTPSDFIKSVTA